MRYLYLMFRFFLVILQDLYRQIVSQTRVVRACIRQSEENAASETLAATKSIVAGSGGVATASAAADHIRKGDGNVKALELRYHLLYLRAFEVQCMLEGLLGRKELSVSVYLLYKNFQYDSAV